jgi:hypothetical protein
MRHIYNRDFRYLVYDVSLFVITSAEVQHRAILVKQRSVWIQGFKPYTEVQSVRVCVWVLFTVLSRSHTLSHSLNNNYFTRR